MVEQRVRRHVFTETHAQVKAGYLEISLRGKGFAEDWEGLSFKGSGLCGKGESWETRSW